MIRLASPASIAQIIRSAGVNIVCLPVSVEPREGEIKWIAMQLNISKYVSNINPMANSLI